jgi:drug/metabolite transporter (DMT)-like permease
MTPDPARGALWAVLAVGCFSANDILIKLLSGGYALHELVFIRTVIGLCVVLGVILPFSGGFSGLKTGHLVGHVLRGLCVVFANLCFFMGLASMPLAETVAIFFISPLLIALGSVVFLGETVGPRRWMAISVGMIGVLLVLRPGSEAFRLVALFPLAAAFGYASFHMMTRRLGRTESGGALVFYTQMTFLVATVAIGLALGDGRFAGSTDPSLAFLFRPWHWPDAADWPHLLGIGLTSAFGGFAISQAYKLSEAALVAPVEYLALPIAIFWGYVIFDELPDLLGLFGIALILVAGLVLIWREAAARRAQRSRPPAVR